MSLWHCLVFFFFFLGMWLFIFPTLQYCIGFAITCQILIGIALNLCDSLKIIDITTILSLPVPEYGISFHIFRTLKFFLKNKLFPSTTIYFSLSSFFNFYSIHALIFQILLFLHPLTLISLFTNS